ncbi:MAG: nucleotidyltransferase [Urechidicola sp.]|nr:nucleotidyltransferase [Urechidicola sp.]
MARKLNEIQQSILLKKAEASELNALDVLTSDEVVGDVTSDSKVSLWRLWVYIVAFAIWSFEILQDTFKSDMEALIAAKRIHNFEWYEDKALAFRYGQNLIEDTDLYSDEGLTAEEIANSKIISHAAVVRIIANGRGTLHVKVAKKTDSVLEPLTVGELTAFDNYMFKVGDAGTLILPRSSAPDNLKLELDIHYNPLVLTEQGVRIDGTSNEPIQDAIREFLYNLKFNGELSITKLIDHLQLVEGVEEPVSKLSQAKYGALAFTTFDEYYIADAGYMIIEDVDLTLNFKAREL